MVNSSHGQLVDDSSAKSNGQQQSPKINSIKKNRLVASDIAEPAAGSDSLVLGEKFSTSLNKKYETQSAGTSGSLTSPASPSKPVTVASVVIGSKKCELFLTFLSSNEIRVQWKCALEPLNDKITTIRIVERDREKRDNDKMNDER